jgi:hypothetical protein
LGLFGVGCRRSEPSPAPSASGQDSVQAGPGQPAPAASTKAAGTPAASAPAASTKAAPAPGKPLEPQNPAERVTFAWNAALDSKNVDALAPLYADHVRFYGKNETNGAVVQAKRVALAKAPEFHQRLDHVHITKTPNGYLVDFDKHSDTGQGSSVAAHLVLEGAGEHLVIAEESDVKTDERLRTAQKQSCADVAVDIASSLPAIVHEQERVSREYPDLGTGGVVYSEDAGRVEAAWGVFHPDRFESYFWINVTEHGLEVENALTSDALAIPQADQARVQRACGGKQ